MTNHLRFNLITLIFNVAIATTTFAPAGTYASTATAPTFAPFTGKVVKNKVRLRTQPTLDASILREMHRDEMLVVVGEMDGFYIVQPPQDYKAYIFRTFVLDNVVEGSHVNVRLQPDLDAPVVAQLNSGDHIAGVVCEANNKWLEIEMPESAHFYIAKEYVEKIGDSAMYAKVEKRRSEVEALMSSVVAECQTELQKPFDQMNINGPVIKLQKIVQQYSDFPSENAKAKELLAQLQDSFLQKKISYLENSSQQTSEQWQKKHLQLISELKEQQDRLAQLEQQIQTEKITSATKEEEGRERERQAALQIQKTTLEAAEQVQKAALLAAEQAQKAAQQAAQQAQQTAIEAARVAREAALKEAYEAQAAAVTNKMATWKNIEAILYENWKGENDLNSSMDVFYNQQRDQAVTLQGVVEEYNRPIKNRPGDYLLLSQSDHLPIAYLYSTDINLQEKVGQVITVQVSPRPNNHFAFPAYYVLAVQ